MHKFIFFKLIMESYRQWIDDRASRLGAALAYYTIFSVAPLFIIAVAVSAFFLGEAASKGHLAQVLQDTVGQQAATAIQDIVKNASRPRTGIIASAVGLVLLLYGASNIFIQLRGSLDTIWNLPPKTSSTWLGFFLNYIISLAVVIMVGFLLFVSAFLTTAISVVGHWFSDLLPFSAILFALINHVASFALVTALFALIYKYIPDARVNWRPVWVGALMSSFLFAIGKWALAFYLSRGSVTNAYGAAGSLVVLLIWVNYSSQIFFFGAEFAEAYAKHKGLKITRRSENQ